VSFLDGFAWTVPTIPVALVVAIIVALRRGD
jgi:hypothetical protein